MKVSAAPGARPHTMLDTGGLVVLILVLALFVGPMVAWVMLGPPVTTGGAFELRMLLWSAWLALLIPLPQIALHIRRHGGPSVRSNRDGFAPDEGALGRIARAHRNLVESLLPFAIAILAAHAMGISNRWTVAASAMYLAARLVHAASYAAGITVVRSAAFYAGLVASTVVLVQMSI